MLGSNAMTLARIATARRQIANSAIQSRCVNRSLRRPDQSRPGRRKHDQILPRRTGALTLGVDSRRSRNELKQSQPGIAFLLRKYVFTAARRPISPSRSAAVANHNRRLRTDPREGHETLQTARIRLERGHLFVSRAQDEIGLQLKL